MEFVYETIEHGKPEFPIGFHKTHCPEGFRLYPHIHEEFEFFVLAEGSGTLLIDGVPFSLSQGEGAFVNSRCIHLGTPLSSDPAFFYAIVFSPQIFGSYVNDIVIDEYVAPVIHRSLELPVLYKREIPWQAEALEIVENMYQLRRQEAPCSELTLKSQLFHLWSIFCQHGRDTGSASATGRGNLDEIRHAIEFIDKEYASKLTLSDLAKQAHMSESHFCRSFTEVMRMTPFAYIQQVRIQKSCQSLKNEDTPISGIALSCGFNDFSYYSRRFREIIGCTPSAYRKQAFASYRAQITEAKADAKLQKNP